MEVGKSGLDVRPPRLQPRGKLQAMTERHDLPAVYDDTTLQQ